MTLAHKIVLGNLGASMSGHIKSKNTDSLTITPTIELRKTEYADICIGGEAAAAGRK